jgi:hypothetical protein
LAYQPKHIEESRPAIGVLVKEEIQLGLLEKDEYQAEIDIRWKKMVTRWNRCVYAEGFDSFTER